MSWAPILDATCGSRMIHFDKNCPDVLFMDVAKVLGCANDAQVDREERALYIIFKELEGGASK